MSSLEQMYQQVILDHARERHGTGDPSSLAASSHQVNPTCGDETTLGVTLSDSGQIESLTWDGDGCPISQALIRQRSRLPLHVRKHAFSRRSRLRSRDLRWNGIIEI